MRLGKNLQAFGISVLLLSLVLPVRSAALPARSPLGGVSFVPTDPDFPIRDATGGSACEEMHPDVAYDEDNDQYLVVYDMDLYGTSDRDIYGVLVSADGHTVGTPFWIASTTNDETYPAVARNPYGNDYLVVWQEYPAAGGAADVWGRIVTPPTVGSRFLIAGATESQAFPDVAYATAPHYYLVVWEDWDSSLANPSNIRGHCVNNDGTLVGSAFTISTHAQAQYRPAVATNAFDYRWLVVWEDYWSSTDHDVRAQAVDPAGGTCHLDGSEIYITGEVGMASAPDVSWGRDDPYTLVYGQFLVTWAENNLVRGQRVDGETLAFSGSRITISDAPSNKYPPAVAWSNSESAWWVVWPDNRTFASGSARATLGGEPTFIFGERVGFDGSVSDSGVNERVSVNPPGYPPSNSQTEAAIAYGYWAESSLVAWQDSGHLLPAPPYLGIWGRIWGPSERVFLPLVLRSN
ncbi:MAG: hypothetical protein JXD18_14160 [Anaerolineae bacterium]|nr:hypothetical protein [Anaerolineae bacterium]